LQFGPSGTATVPRELVRTVLLVRHRKLDSNMYTAIYSDEIRMTVPHVRMTIQWLVPVGKTRSMTEALHLLMVSTRAEPGCVACSVAADVAEKGVIRYSEEWSTEDSLQRQFTTDRFKSLIALVEDATEPPVVEFLLPGGTRGLDYVEDVCGRQV
jgi:quinol monooxygenase YgiN